MAALAFAEGIAARRYLVVWQDTISLYRHMLDHAPNTGMLHNNYGRYVELHAMDLADQSNEAARAGRTAEAQAAFAEANEYFRQARRHFDEAVHLYRDANAIGAPVGDALVNLGKAVVADAIRDREAVSRQAATNPAAAAAFQDAVRRVADAVREAEALFLRARAVSRDETTGLNMDYAAANNLGQIAFGFRGDATAGISWFQKALAVNPYYPDAHLNLGLALERRAAPGDLEEAWRHLLFALSARPTDRHIRDTLEGFLQRHPEFRARATR